jgi:hypothetical protein
MWYKEENNEWLTGNRIEFPDGIILENNHEITKEGWFWSDEEPEEYNNNSQNEINTLK